MRKTRQKRPRIVTPGTMAVARDLCYNEYGHFYRP